MIKQLLQALVAKATSSKPEEIKIEKPPKAEFGDYAVFTGENAAEVAGSIKSQITNHKQIEKVEIKGKYINFFLSHEFLQSELERISVGAWDLMLDAYRGRTVMVEYTDPNPFKLFHIGHLMPNTIGEAIARLHEAVGAKVIRANYQGDVGMHVAKALWALEKSKTQMPNDKLGEAYVEGSLAYDEDQE